MRLHPRDGPDDVRAIERLSTRDYEETLQNIELLIERWRAGAAISTLSALPHSDRATWKLANTNEGEFR